MLRRAGAFDYRAPYPPARLARPPHAHRALCAPVERQSKDSSSEVVVFRSSLLRRAVTAAFFCVFLWYAFSLLLQADSVALFAYGVALCLGIVWVVVSILRGVVIVDDTGFVVRFMVRRRVLWSDLREVQVRGSGFAWAVKVKTSRSRWSRWLPVGSNSFGRPREESQPMLLARTLEAHLTRSDERGTHT